MKISEKIYEDMLACARGGYLGISHVLVQLSRDGKSVEPVEDDRFIWGRYLVVENYYGYKIFTVLEDGTLIVAEKEEE
jgi:hypothetical protein